ncbi:MAG: hypothetical protein ACRD1R_15695 [Acidobacteriota bacterium]
MNTKQIFMLGVIALLAVWVWASHQDSEASWLEEHPGLINGQMIAPGQSLVPVTLPNGQSAYLVVPQSGVYPGGYQQYPAAQQYAQPAARPAVLERVVERPVYRTRYVENNTASADAREKQGRSWEREVLIVGASAGAGAAIGAVAGGKKGAAVGALSGGVAGLVYDLATRK